MKKDFYSLDNLPNEQWKDIDFYRAYYQISNFGRVKSIGRFANVSRGNLRVIKERIMSQSKTTKGYKTVKLTKMKYKKNVYIHRLVASHFVDNPNKKEQVNHINGIKEDNNFDNLEWVTNLENMQHARKIGLFNTKHRS
jgi:hypothetical protein